MCRRIACHAVIQQAAVGRAQPSGPAAAAREIGPVARPQNDGFQFARRAEASRHAIALEREDGLAPGPLVADIDEFSRCVARLLQQSDVCFVGAERFFA